MQFMALIYNKETGNHDPETFQAYGKFTQDMIAQGHFKSGDALQPTATATCLTIRDGKTSLKDGPFSETKEQLGGYYILECAPPKMKPSPASIRKMRAGFSPF